MLQDYHAQLPGTSTPQTVAHLSLATFITTDSTSVVETFSPLQRKVSPVRSLKKRQPSSSIIIISPATVKKLRHLLNDKRHLLRKEEQIDYVAQDIALTFNPLQPPKRKKEKERGRKRKKGGGVNSCFDAKQLTYGIGSFSNPLLRSFSLSFFKECQQSQTSPLSVPGLYDIIRAALPQCGRSHYGSQMGTGGVNCALDFERYFFIFALKKLTPLPDLKIQIFFVSSFRKLKKKIHLPLAFS